MTATDRPPPGDLATVRAALDPTTTAGEVWGEAWVGTAAAELDAMLPPRPARAYVVRLPPRAVPAGEGA